MNEVLIVDKLKKTFNLSKKQQKLNQTNQTKKVAVDNLSFKVNKGEIYGLLGPNGAGKTTTLRIISTLISADEGDCLVFNNSVKTNPVEVRKAIGFLTSELKLEDFFTPNYLFDFFSRLHGVDEITKENWKNTLFKQFGIDTFMEVKVANLSTGMKQKTSLAVSLAHNPDIIIFDEPTNGLDVLTAKVVTDFLLHLKSLGKTIIISTHIFSLVEKICDSVGIIINGHMIKDGKLSEVCQNDTLENVFFDLYRKEVGEIV